ncbi:hypothetical protein [Streptomyces sp. NPDC058202]|uniref:hypothetical protein n=1 Tax=Streptomyces sp. NPDC058202 TaxID=3346380 RepID=UPI0036E7728A
MHKLIRRMLGIGPTVLHRDALFEVGHAMAAGFAEGLRDPRPLTAEEMAELMAYTGSVARRSFSTLYDEDA